MNAAVIGLIGVVIGGLLSASSSFLAGLSAEKRKGRREVRQAARLVELELSNAIFPLNRIMLELRRKLDSTERMTDEAYGTTQELRTPSAGFIAGLESIKPVAVDIWESNQEILAIGLPDRPWDNVVLAYDRIAGLIPDYHNILTQRMLPELSDEPRFESAVDVIEKALNSLRPFTRY